MNKRGQEGGEEAMFLTIASLVILVFVLVSLVSWINSSMTGDLAKAEITAKQIALFIDSAEPGMEITVKHSSADVLLDENSKSVTVKIKNTNYTYGYISSYKISIENSNFETKIRVS